MNKNRLEAFSDGVIAIIITIMVLELKVPHEGEFSALTEKLPTFLSYVVSFIYVGIYWNNHHHLLHTSKRVNGAILWANLHLLFWLSLLPFATGWMGENHFAPATTAFYGIILLLAAIAFNILQIKIINEHGKDDSTLAKAVGNGIKEKLSLACYFVGIPLSYFVSQWVGVAIFVLPAIMWFLPDPRIEREIEKKA
ncbi:MAG TPA: TMEM175 family protein [Pyrinomonadaceae bacterium]|nr:TMEM175 family protein [Pyrinomonadaceae bacterium]